MNKRLPLTIDPIKFAEKRLFIEGSISMRDMSRLADMCQLKKLSAEASVRLDGGIDKRGFHYLHGIVEANIPLICQRCLKSMSYHVFSEFTLSVVFNEEQAKNLPPRYEPLIIKENSEVVLSDLIEDELLLALPIIPKHDEKVCSAAVSNQAYESNLASKPKSSFAKQLAKELAKSNKK